MTKRDAQRAEKILKRRGYPAYAFESRISSANRYTWYVRTPDGMVATYGQAEKMVNGDTVYLASHT